MGKGVIFGTLGLSAKISASCSLLALVLMVLVGLPLAHVQRERVLTTISTNKEKLDLVFDRFVSKQREKAKADALANAAICAGFASLSLYNLAPEDIAPSLRNTLELQDVQAIAITDSYGKPFAAIWRERDGHVGAGKELPSSFSKSLYMDIQAESRHNKELVGTVHMLVSNEAMEKEIAEEKARSLGDAEEFAAVAMSQFKRSVLIQASGVALIAFLLSIAISLAVRGLAGKPIAKASELARQMARGDFTREAKSSGSDEVATLVNALGSTSKSLGSLIGQVQKAASQIVSSGLRITVSAREQEGVFSKMATSSNEIVSSTKEISATSQQLATSMDDVAVVSGRTAELASSGRSSLEGMRRGMEQLASSTKEISARLSKINEKAGNINGVVETITKVADQTNLLSLNAAIEAEKAGEYGKGFSVVATEIRRLADQAAVATLDISEIVGDMQSSVSSAVVEMDKFSEEVRNGVKDAESINSQLGRIMEEVQSLPPVFSNVAGGMKHQAEGAEQINAAMMSLNESVNQAGESIKEFAEVVRELNEATQALQDGMSVFKTV